MATETQYNVCKAIYDQEIARYAAAGVKANIYITLLSALTGAIIFKYQDLTPFEQAFHINPYCAPLTAAVLLIALALTLLAVLERKYEAVSNLELVVLDEVAENVTDEEFLDSRLVDLVVATESSVKRNEITRKFLTNAEAFLLLGVGIQFLGIILPSAGIVVRLLVKLLGDGSK